MVKRQKVEEVGAAVVEIVFGVVGLVSERARELAEVNRQAVAQWRDVSPIRLPDVAVNLRSQLVDGASLHGLRRLAELQVKSRAEPAPGIDLRRLLEDDGRLIQTEAVAQHVIGAQQVDASERAIEVVAVITVDRQVDCRVAPEIKRLAVISGEF